MTDADERVLRQVAAGWRWFVGGAVVNAASEALRELSSKAYLIRSHREAEGWLRDELEKARASAKKAGEELDEARVQLNKLKAELTRVRGQVADAVGREAEWEERARKAEADRDAARGAREKFNAEFAGWERRARLAEERIDAAVRELTQ